MKINLALIFLFIISLSCVKDKPDFRLSQDEFQSAMMDIELAREASRSASVAVQDSFFDNYLDAIAIRYGMSSEELQDEMKLQLGQIDDLDEFYDDFRIRLDSLTLDPVE